MPASSPSGSSSTSPMCSPHRTSTPRTCTPRAISQAARRAARGEVESDQMAVSGLLDHTPPMKLEALGNVCVEISQDARPTGIADLRGLLRRPHDVGEQQREELVFSCERAAGPADDELGPRVQALGLCRLIEGAAREPRPGLHPGCGWPGSGCAPTGRWARSPV